MEITIKNLIQIPIILKWDRREKEKIDEKLSTWVYRTVYHNCATGKLGHDVAEVVNTGLPYLLLDRKSKDVDGFTIQYDEDLKMLAVIWARFNTRAIKEGECRYWEERNRFYVDIDKNIFYNYYGNSKYNRYEKTYDKKCWSIPFDCNKMIDIRLCSNTKKSASIDEIHKMFPKCVQMSGNRVSYLNNYWSFLYFLQYKEPVVKSGPKQRRIDELAAIELPNIDFSKIELGEAKGYWDACSRLSFVQKVPKEDEELCVLRTFEIIRETGEAFEFGRYYIGKKETIACKKNNKGQYIQAPLHNDASNWNFMLMDIEKDAAKGTKLEYCMSIIDEFEDDMKGIAIMAFNQWPVFEMLYKLGHQDYIKTTLKSNSYSSPIKGLEGDFGKLGTGKNLNKILGLNKHQMKVALDEAEQNDNRYGNRLSAIAIVKKIAGGIEHRDYWQHSGPECKVKYVSIADMDWDTFRKLFWFAKEVSSSSGTTYLYGSKAVNINCAVMINKLYGMKATINMLDSILMASKKTNNDGWRRNSFVILLRDYLDMVSEMNMANRFKPYFDTVEELKEMHDEVAILHTTFKQKIEMEKWDNRKAFWNKFVYSDSNYEVIAPDKPEDLAVEGLELRHCVKGYIPKVTRGDTNVVFIRKAEEIDKPFFTAEISNTGYIEQIHGFGNRNLSTEPDLIYFVENWRKACKLKEHDFNKVR